MHSSSDLVHRDLWNSRQTSKVSQRLSLPGVGKDDVASLPTATPTLPPSVTFSADDMDSARGAVQVQTVECCATKRHTSQSSVGFLCVPTAANTNKVTITITITIRAVYSLNERSNQQLRSFEMIIKLLLSLLNVNLATATHVMEQ